MRRVVRARESHAVKGAADEFPQIRGDRRW